jgi:hypothetical protein
MHPAHPTTLDFPPSREIASQRNSEMVRRYRGKQRMT